MHTFHLTVMAADKPVYNTECESLIFPATSGDYGIQAGHSNLVSAIVPGSLSFRTPDQRVHELIVSGGLIKVEHNDVVILVDTAEKKGELDIKRAEHDREVAIEAMLQSHSNTEYEVAKQNMQRAMMRIRELGEHNDLL